MKVICPQCATKEVKEPGAKKRFVCAAGHEFEADEGLISLSQALILGKALGHPIRLKALLQYKQTEELAADDIAKAIGEPVSNVSYHMKVLRDCKPPFLLFTRDEAVRGALKKFYRLNPNAIAY
jgi:hypothetical protein